MVVSRRPPLPIWVIPSYQNTVQCSRKLGSTCNGAFDFPSKVIWVIFFLALRLVIQEVP